jgi:hypothetical protein
MSDIDMVRRGVEASRVWKGIRSSDKNMITNVMYDMESEDLLYAYGALRLELFNRSKVPHLDSVAKKLLDNYAMFLEECYMEIRLVRSVMEDACSLPDTYQTYQKQMTALGLDPDTYHEWVASREKLTRISAVQGS